MLTVTTSPIPRRVRQALATAAAALGVAALAAGCGPGRGATPAGGSATTAADSAALSPPPAPPPCRDAPAPRRWRHVVWIIEENRSFAQVAGSPSAPYLARLARECGLATRYDGIAHPSLPNYLALTSGSTHGVTDDAGPAAHPIGGASIFSLLGGRWRTLAQSMPAPCDPATSGTYAVRHNPAVYYTAVRRACARQDVALGARPDLTAAFTLIIPNVCNDMHDCSTATGDAWLAHELPLVLASPAYRSGTTAVFITWDENDAGGRRVPLYVVAPSVRPGTRATGAFDHYSLLRTTEELLGLRPLLGKAAGAPSMRAAFGL
jgi:hypothetical protein